MSSHQAPEQCSAKAAADARSPALAQRSCHSGAGLRDRSQVHLNDAEDFRTRWLFVFLLQQRPCPHPRPCSSGWG
jgi:hypothetical protein